MNAPARLLPALGALGLLAAPASAQDPAATVSPSPVPTTSATPVPTTPPIVPTPVPTAEPRPEPVDARLRLQVIAPHRADGKKLAVKGETVRVQGVMRPAVQAQRAVVQFKRGRKVVKRKAVRFDADGAFRTTVKLRRLGRLKVRAVHPGTRAVRTARSEPKQVSVLKPSLGYGSSGTLVKLFSRGLDRMQYATGTVSSYDARLGRAVMAYRKVNGLPRTETPTPEIVRDVLAGKGAYKVRFPGLGKHVEADISRQVLALVDGRKLIRVYHTSSGAPATPTILGTYSFYSKTIGTNSKGMVDSNYFIRGYAIHGYHSVPPYNASHGCLRVPIPDARNIYDWIDLGDRIRVTP